MCLDKRTDWHKGNEGVGWKVFRQKNYLDFLFREGFSRVPSGKWITSRQRKIRAKDGSEYYTGFHVYTDHRDAVAAGRFYVCFYGTDIIVKRVRYRRVICSGEYSGDKTIVAREILVED